MGYWIDQTIEWKNAMGSRVKKSLEASGFIIENAKENDTMFDIYVLESAKEGERQQRGSLGNCMIGKTGICFPIGIHQKLYSWIINTFPEGTIIREMGECDLLATAVISEGKIVWLSTFSEALDWKPAYKFQKGWDEYAAADEAIRNRSKEKDVR